METDIAELWGHATRVDKMMVHPWGAFQSAHSAAWRSAASCGGDSGNEIDSGPSSTLMTMQSAYAHKRVAGHAATRCSSVHSSSETAAQATLGVLVERCFSKPTTSSNFYFCCFLLPPLRSLWAHAWGSNRGPRLGTQEKALPSATKAT